MSPSGTRVSDLLPWRDIKAASPLPVAQVFVLPLDWRGECGVAVRATVKRLPLRSYWECCNKIGLTPGESVTYLI